jgi:hypothetical protein
MDSQPRSAFLTQLAAARCLGATLPHASSLGTGLPGTVQGAREPGHALGVGSCPSHLALAPPTPAVRVLPSATAPVSPFLCQQVVSAEVALGPAVSAQHCPLEPCP